jgi:hypothetical protein
MFYLHFTNFVIHMPLHFLYSIFKFLTNWNSSTTQFHQLDPNKQFHCRRPCSKLTTKQMFCLAILTHTRRWLDHADRICMRCYQVMWSTLYHSWSCHHISLTDFMVSPTGCGRSVSRLLRLRCHEVRLRRPDEVDGDIWIWSNRRGLNP